MPSQIPSDRCCCRGVSRKPSATRERTIAAITTVGSSPSPW
jgi:hypothetical protein